MVGMLCQSYSQLPPASSPARSQTHVLIYSSLACPFVSGVVSQKKKGLKHMLRGFGRGPQPGTDRSRSWIVRKEVVIQVQWCTEFVRCTTGSLEHT